jgi:hypothetical protein
MNAASQPASRICIYTRLSVSAVTAPVFGKANGPSDVAGEPIVDTAAVAATPDDRRSAAQ